MIVTLSYLTKTDHGVLLGGPATQTNLIFPKSCQVHLLYIGVNMFAPLKPRPDPLLQYIQNYQKASDANWTRLQEEHYAAHFMESEYSNYVKIVGEKQGYNTSGHHRKHPVSSTATLASALIDGTLGTNNNQEIFNTPGQVVFPEPIIAEVNMEDATTSNNGSNSSNINAANVQNSVDFSAESHMNESLTTPPPEPTEPSNAIVNTESVDTSLDVNNTNLTDMISKDSTGGVTVTANHDSRSTLPDGNDSEATIKTPAVDLEDTPTLQLKHECFISVTKLDDQTILKLTSKTYSTPASNPASDTPALMTLRPRSCSSSRRSLTSALKPVSYFNMDPDSNDDDEKLVKRKAKMRPSVEPSKS